METELGKVLTYCERLPPLKPHDFLKKNVYFHKTYGHYTWQGVVFGGKVQHANAKVVIDFLSFFLYALIYMAIHLFFSNTIKIARDGKKYRGPL